ncbi:hypothetical protein BDR03DRAFT_946125 [Suillus americanus]|nr:hypothetical protein BDR03DRAFT_946125 [Suillus americanus]
MSVYLQRLKTSPKTPQSTSPSQLGHVLVHDDPQITMPLAFDELNAVLPLLTPPEPPVLAEPLAFEGQLSDLEYGPLGFTSTLPEAMSIGDLSQDLLPGTVSYGLGVPGLQPQYDKYSDGKTLSESSARRDQQPCLPIAQDGRDKVMCTWPDCSRVVQKKGLARHVNEMHRRVVKAVCYRCGNGFTRQYMLKSHLCRAKYRKS